MTLTLDEKISILNHFAENKIQILISTSLIEVGIDVENASIMAIFNPERFGLASLHQLRGRVGRGKNPGFLFLLIDKKLSNEVMQRLQVIESTCDGFKIAEVDLKLRGPGNLMGTQQSGVLNLRIADIVKDAPLLKLARTTAMNLLENDPSLSKLENRFINSAYQEISKNSTLWSNIS